MSNEEWQRLREQLRAEPPAGLAALPGRDLHHLAEAIGSARRRQAAALAQAGDKAFGYVPRLLRGPIRKILG